MKSKNKFKQIKQVSTVYLDLINTKYLAELMGAPVEWVLQWAYTSQLDEPIDEIRVNKKDLVWITGPVAYEILSRAELSKNERERVFNILKNHNLIPF